MHPLLLSISLLYAQQSDISNLFPYNEVKIADGANPLVDTRLLGTWISDKEKTLKYFRFKPNITPKQRSQIENMFGKLKIEFRKNEVCTEFEGRTAIEPYSVIAIDNNSVVISGKDFNGQKLTHIHFEKDGYYVQSGYIIEFFKRVQSSQ